MGFLLRVSQGIDRVAVWVGRAVMWLILLSIFISAANAVTRKLFSLSSNAWLEAQWFLFGAAYMFAAAYTLQRNEHIRIDIISNLLPKRARDWIDIFGHLFILLPFCALMVRETWAPMMRSFALGEVSANYGGLLVWPYKFFVAAGFAMLFVQGLSELIKRIAVMRRLIPDPHAQQSGHAPAPAEEGAI
jgi:TRAP-type mannitol/chloroaromatic compound transport system permease small subunit